jgi:hypothetical protein
MLDNFLAGIEFTGDAGVVRFTDPQTEDYLLDPKYAFYNRSSSVIKSLPATARISDVELAIGDSTDNGSGESHPFTLPSTNKLLARLSFDAISPGFFTVGLVSGSPFFDADFNSIPFTFTGATIEVTAVPEPSSIVSGVLLGCAGATWCLRRRKALRKQVVST